MKKSTYGVGMRYRVCGIPGVKDESFVKLKDAKDWLASAQTDARRGVFIDPELGQILLADYFSTVYWPGVSVAVGTERTMLQKINAHVLPHLGHLPIATIDEEHLRIWVASLLKKLEPSTVRVIYEYLSAILSSAVPKRITRNPCSTRGIKPKTPEVKARALTKLQGAGVRDGLRHRSRIAFDLGTGAGLRQGEVFGFSPSDVDRVSEELHIRRQLQLDKRGRPYFKLPKGDKERRVPLSLGLVAALDEYVDNFTPVKVTLPWRGPGGPESGELTVTLLMTTRFGNPINQSSWNYDAWKPALCNAGLIEPWDSTRASHHRGGWEAARELGFHITRHTYASVQLQGGESIVALSQWLGHDDPGFTLRRYTHFMPEDGRRGRSAVDAWLGLGPAASAPPFEVLEPLNGSERVVAGDLAMLYLVAVPAGQDWTVSLLRGPGERPLGKILVRRGTAEQVLASAASWLRGNVSALGGQVVEVKNMDIPSQRGGAALGRVVLAADVAGDFLASLAA
ncbi:tyrosine-type recombinase/integrase [Kitasatospora sp. NPDC056531]|uniref:tyrosine-type recombinase/integrase n=1 Tax=Kitasatospora sp. NPDC056531 TaxID=3345856 RepID=UPI0036C79442